MIFGSFERMVALRYLRARRKESIVSVIAGFSLAGIALGVATLIIVMAVMNGFREDILSRILGVNGHINIYPAGRDSMIADYDAKIIRIEAVPGVVSVVPVVDGQVLAISSSATQGAQVRGMKPEDLKKLPRVADHIVDGSLEKYTSGEGILIGLRMAQAFGIQAGDDLTLISPKGNVTAFGTVPTSRAFTVAGVFNTDESQYDGGLIFMPLDMAQAYFKISSGGVTSFELKVNNPDRARIIASEIGAAFGGDLRVFSWEQSNTAFFTALNVERNVMFLILTMIILVAILNVISGLTMLVKDKGADIAILRTMGATRGAVMRIFFMTGASVGVIGTIVGFILGLLFCRNIESVHQFLRWLTGTDVFSPEVYYLSEIPAKLDWSETTAIVAMALALSFLATLFPSWRAARTDPVEALRYE